MIKEKLKEIRVSKGMSIRKLADYSGVSKSTISDVENGKVNPTTITIKKLAKGLGVPEEVFFKSANTEQLNKWDKENPNLKDELEYFEQLDITSIDDAMKFILQQPLFMDFGGYDLDEMSEEEIMDLANDMLLAMRLSIEKKKRQ